LKTTGELVKHRQLRIGWFDQHSNEALNGEQTPVEYLMVKYNIDHQVCLRKIFFDYKIRLGGSLRCFYKSLNNLFNVFFGKGVGKSVVGPSI